VRVSKVPPKHGLQSPRLRQEAWLREARKTALGVNAARWLGAVLPVFAGVCLLSGCIALLWRGSGKTISDGEALILVSLPAALALLWGFAAFWRTRKRRFSTVDALIRLDITLGLHSRLESAFAGVGEWPEPPPLQGARVDDGFQWRWGRLVAPVMAGSAFLVAALLVPIPSRPVHAATRVGMPLAWAQVEESLETLREEELAAPEALADFERKLDSLRQQESDRWHLHSSLEAGATLRDELAAAATALQRQLDLAAATSEQFPAMRPEDRLDALDGLKAAALPLDPSKLDALQQMAAQAELTPGQLEKLQAALKENAQKMAGALAALGELPEADSALAETEGTAAAQDAPDGPGPGGDHAPLGQKANPVSLVPATQEALPEADSFERFALGETLAVTTGTHTVAPDDSSSTAGGSAASPGRGGEAVWKEQLSPAEQALLKRLLK